MALALAALAAAAAWWVWPAPASDPAASLRLGPPATVAPARGRTNVVLLVVDTVRADHVGAFGHDRPTTPRIDALAAQGVKFSNTWSTSSWTRPAMGTLLTGLHPRALGIAEERYDRLQERDVTLAERLRDTGYLTLGVTSNPNVNSFFGFAQGFDAYWDSGVVFKFMPAEKGYQKYKAHRSPMQSATDTTDRTLALLDRYSDALPGQSFYLQVLYVDPHWPYAPPAGALAAVGGGTRPVDQYDGEIRYADDEIGRLLDGMSDRGLLDDTLIVVTSDHGEGLDSHPGVPLSSAHGYTLYESVLRVPLVMWHPSLPAGTDVTALVSSLDVLPTVLDVVGLPGDGLPGRSLARLARGGAEDPVPAFAETDWRYTRKLAVVTDAWHLVSNPDAAAYRADGTHEQATLSGPEKRSLTLVPDVELYPRGSQPQVPDRAVDDPTARDTLLGLLDAFDAGVPIRPPENRDPKDTLVRGDGTVEVHGGSVPTMDAGLGDQLRSLGYLGDD